MASNEILFNSPALHSLKRVQLVRICKRHGIKAAGKNTDLIERLKEYAKNLPADGEAVFEVPTSDAAGDDAEDEDDDGGDSESHPYGSSSMSSKRAPVAARPSEPWSIIEEDSGEEDNAIPTVKSQQSSKSGSSLSTIGEFGTEGSTSSKNSSVGSSIKAFASSLKRAATGGGSARSKRSAQDAHRQETRLPDVPPSPTRSASPEPPQEPVPNTYCPDPALAQSTIRLIPSTTNLLDQTANDNTFMVPTKFDDDDSGSDNDQAMDDDMAQASHKRKSSLYPELPEFAKLNAAASMMPGGLANFNFPFNPAPTPPSSSPTFGIQEPLNSPPVAGPSVGGDTSKAAITASVLEEMNRRMGVNPTSSAAITFSVFEKKSTTVVASAATSSRGADRYEKAHQGMFSKMDSILNHYAVRRPAGAPAKGRKSAGRPERQSKTRSSLSATPAAAKRRSRASMAVARPSVLLPAKKTTQGDNDVEMGTTGPDQTEGGRKHITIFDPVTAAEQPKSAFSTDDDEPTIPGGFAPSKPTVIVNSTPAAMKKLDKAKAKRRSSVAKATMGRSSIIGGAANGKNVATKPASGFGAKFSFLKSSAKLVKSIWGGGSSSKTAAAKTAAPAPPPVPAPAGNVKAKAQIFSNNPTATTFSPPTTTSHVAAAKAEVSRRAALAGAPTSAGQSSLPTPPTNANGVLSPPAPSLASRAVKPPGLAARSTAASSSRSSSLGVGLKSPSTTTRRVVSASSRKSSGIGLQPQRPPLPTAFGVPSSSGSGSVKSKLSLPSASTTNTAGAGANSLGKKAATAGTTSSFGFNFGASSKTKRASTLTAPTASSLARLQSTVKPPLPSPSTTNENNNTAASKSFGFGLNFSPRPVSPTKLPMPRPGSVSPSKPTGAMLGAITNTPAAVGVDDSMAEFAVPPTKSAANTISSSTSANSMGSRSSRRPRISRSKVIAKLGEKRAFEAAAASAASRVPSVSRRSQGGSGATPKRRTRDSELAVQASARKAMRRSEVASRKSRAAVGGIEWDGVGLSGTAAPTPTNVQT